MMRPVYLSCLSLAVGAASPAPVFAQTAFVSETRAACASELAAAHKYMVELQGFTLAEADGRVINPRLADLVSLPRYALTEMTENDDDQPTSHFYRCAAKLRLGQLIANQPPPLSPADLAATKAAAVGRCGESAEKLRRSAPNPQIESGEIINMLLDDMVVLSKAELDHLFEKAEAPNEDPAAEVFICVGRVMVAQRSGGLAQTAAVETPTAPPSSADPTGATAEQIAQAEAINAKSRDIADQQRADSDAFMREAAIRSGKIYQSNGPEGRQVDLHPTTGQRCVTAELGANEPYGDNGTVHVINFTNVCGKIFSVRARIVPLGPISPTSNGVQGTGIGDGSLGSPAKSRLICIQDSASRVGSCSGFTEWWATSSS